jgi:hypothetical protein
MTLRPTYAPLHDITHYTPLHDITSAQGRRSALHGEASSSWALLTSTGAAFEHNITIPAGGIAKVMIPSANGQSGVTEGKGVPVAAATGVAVIGMETINRIEYLVLEVVAGSYRFKSVWGRKEMTMV